MSVPDFFSLARKKSGTDICVWLFDECEKKHAGWEKKCDNALTVKTAQFSRRVIEN
jgi:hypothetical protein